jgi:hypothetical protein
VEIAASIVTGVQLYLLSSTVGDLIEGKTEGRKTKLAASLMLTVVAAFPLKEICVKVGELAQRE